MFSLSDKKVPAEYLSMLENAPINVIFADRDFKIRYMNPAPQPIKDLYVKPQDVVVT
jgi:PAS domain-containing protein